MEHGGDRLVLSAAVLEDQRRDGEQMRDIGNLSALAVLARVELARKGNRAIETAPDRAD
jgi:hypothetical protein